MHETNPNGGALFVNQAAGAQGLHHCQIALSQVSKKIQFNSM